MKSHVCCDVISMGPNKLSCFKENIMRVRFENVHKKISKLQKDTLR